MKKWILCSDRLPPRGVYVAVAKFSEAYLYLAKRTWFTGKWKFSNEKYPKCDISPHDEWRDIT